MRGLPHQFRAKTDQEEKRQIAAVQSELPELVAHTATGGPGGTRELFVVPSLDVRSEILWRNPSALGGHAMIQYRKCFQADDCGAAAETGKS